MTIRACTTKMPGRTRNRRQPARNFSALAELIGYAGFEAIDRIEVEARRNPPFRELLGGVWRHGASDAVWRQVEAARGEPW